MSKEIYISSTPHETRLAIVEREELSEIYYERENEYTLAGSIYNGRVTRVLPGMQSAFVDVGLERDAFLYITDFLEEQGEDSSDFEGGSDGRKESRDRATGDGASRRSERGNDRHRNGRGRDVQSRDLPTTTFDAPETTHAEAEQASPARDRDADEDAEGSRRWRGRRGRRRGGRSGEPSGAQEPEPSIVIEGEFAGLSSEEPAGEPLERIFGSAAVQHAPSSEPARDAGGSRERNSRDRGSRDRGRDRGRDRDRADDWGRPSLETGAPDPTPGTEPLILPGESLARYGRSGQSASQQTAAAQTTTKPKPSLPKARPSTEIDLSAAAWDGGTTLPGETLSRKRSQSQEEATAAPATALEQAPSDANPSTDTGSGAARRRDRDRRRGRSDRPSPPEPRASLSPTDDDDKPLSFTSGAVLHENLAPIDAVQPATTSQHDIDPSAANVSAIDLFYEPQTDLVALADPSPALLEAVNAMHAGIELEPAHAGEDFQEETHEYEPEENSSASYRVDPAGPSEFRQGAVTDDQSLGEGDPAVQEDYAGAGHEYTTIGSTGEMLSELPGEIAAALPDEDPTNPIEHETAVLTQQGSALLDPADTAQPLAQSSPQAFAPGYGLLEEELIEDEETDLLAIAASYSDDTEEETFEAGAEIGSLVRDRTLDQLTHGEVALLDELEDEDFDIDEEILEEGELDAPEQTVAGDETFVEEDDLFETLSPVAFDEDGGKPSAATMGDFPEFAQEPPVRGPRPNERRDERDRDGRRSDSRRSDGRGSYGRDRGDRGSADRRGMAGSRSGAGRGSRPSMQTIDLPAISDLLKPGQEVLVQIAKEPIAKKGARITSHIALPGRFLVFMPTVNHVGVSRKIESDGERRRLKEVLLSEKGEAAGGFIVRTAAMGASEDELRSDLRFLLNLWADIKQRSESSKSPALIYHDLNLVERVLRDQISDNFSAIWCDTEGEYERVLRFLQRFEPSLMRRVKLYTKDTPLFDQFGISEEINKALRSKVWLRSGGSIVINQTEALVAIDINTGKYVGKTARLEDTIVKTNLDAIPEIVRQIRLRDLGGIIVIDFIDMDDRKNRQKVLMALEDELKKDRAPSKVLQFNDFGLVAITRKRVKQSLERTLSTTCAICTGTGMVKSPVTVCNEIYIELRKMHKQLDKGDIMLRVNPEVVKQLKANNAKWLGEMEEIAGKTILIKSDPALHPEQFDIH